MGWLVLIAVILICTVPFYIQYKQREEIETKAAIAKQEHKSQCQIKYDSAKRLANLPQSGLHTVTIFEHGGGRMYYHWSYYVWKSNNNFCLFPASIHGSSPSSLFEKGTFTLSEDKYKVWRIPTDKIMFYRQIGEVYTTVSGSGGNSSFSPITGFHGKINPIKIESEVHDERSTQLFYDDGHKDCVLVFKDYDYYTLRKTIPDKDYQVVTISQAVNQPQSPDDFARLKKLNEMHEAGLISDADFECKKAEILNNI